MQKGCLAGDRCFWWVSCSLAMVAAPSASPLPVPCDNQRRQSLRRHINAFNQVTLEVQVTTNIRRQQRAPVWNGKRARGRAEWTLALRRRRRDNPNVADLAELHLHLPDPWSPSTSTGRQEPYKGTTR